MTSSPVVESGLIPLVVGVTGHRDLREEDRPALVEVVRRLFQHLSATPAGARGGRPPLLLVTPLAEGADRLVAHVALEFGARLIVPLPLPREEYERDFATPESRSEFAALLSAEHTVRIIELPRVPGSGPDGHATDVHTQRLLQYTLAGVFVARYAQVLVALWDGAPSDRPGGTADIVAFRRTGRFALLPADLAARFARVADPFGLPHDPLGRAETGPVHQIVTPRAGQPVPAHAFAGRRLAPAVYDHHPRQRHRYFVHLARAHYHRARFNAEAATLGEDAVVSASAERLCPADAVPEPLAPLRTAFALADTLARRYQRRTYAAFRWMFWLAFLAVALFEGYAALADAPAAGTPWIIGYVALIAVADAIYLFVRGRDVQNRFQDYRALAEGLRVQFYWRLTGLADAASDCYLRQQRDEVVWIRNAISAWGIWTPSLHPADSHAADRLWIDAQRRYFVAARAASVAGRARDRGLGSGLIAASVACALVAAANGVARVTPRLAWIAIGALLLGALAIFAHHLSLSIHDAADESDDETARSIAGPTEGWLVTGFGGGVIAMLLARLAVRAAAAHPGLDLVVTWHAWFVTVLVLTALAGTLLHAYADKRAFAEHARRYRRMGDVFAAARIRLDELKAQSAPAHETQAVVLELGREALAEHADWVLLHRERQVEPPRVDL